MSDSFTARLLFGHAKVMMGMLWIIICLGMTISSGCDDDTPSTGDSNTVGGQIEAGAEAGGSMMMGGMSSGGEGGVASCMSDDDCPAGTLCDPATQACRSSCDRDQECGPSEGCISNFCTALDTCVGGVGGECNDGQVCNCNGLCIPLVGNPCQNDLQCQVSEYCDSCKGQCQERVKPCQPCTDSVSCERPDDLCAPVGMRGELACLRSCVGQGSCDNLGPGYLCQAVGSQGDFCIPEAGECAQLTECMRDAECEAGLFCNERFQCQPGCIDDTSCSDGLICQGLRCAPLCMNDEQCLAEGAVCGEDGRCQVPGGCQSSRDCAEAETYCNLDTLRCVSGCQVDDDCLDASKECVAGHCRPRGCSRNYQCSFGQVCDLESSMCVMAEGRHCEAGCDPMNSATSCGMDGQRCLSLQDEDENPLGDFCFEPCQEEPNPCPQGYSCQTLEDPNAGELKLCIRRCDISPVMP